MRTKSSYYEYTLLKVGGCIQIHRSKDVGEFYNKTEEIISTDTGDFDLLCDTLVSCNEEMKKVDPDFNVSKSYVGGMTTITYSDKNRVLPLLIAICAFFNQSVCYNNMTTKFFK